MTLEEDIAAAREYAEGGLAVSRKAVERILDAMTATIEGDALTGYQESTLTVWQAEDETVSLAIDSPYDKALTRLDGEGRRRLIEALRTGTPLDHA